MAVLKTMTKAGEARYEVRYRVPDRTEPTGRRQKQKTFQTYRKALAFDEKHKTAVREGDYVAPSDLTVKEVMETWLEAGKTKGVTKQGPWKIQTYSGHKTRLDKYIEPRLGRVKATSLRAYDVEISGAEWRKTVSSKTVNKVFATLSAAYNYAGKKLGIKKNPMDDVEQLAHRATPEDMEAEALGAVADHGEDNPEVKANVLRAIRPDEVYSALELKKLIDAAAPGLERALFMTAILTGLRHGELNGLRWESVNLKTAKAISSLGRPNSCALGHSFTTSAVETPGLMALIAMSR